MKLKWAILATVGVAVAVVVVLNAVLGWELLYKTTGIWVDNPLM